MKTYRFIKGWMTGGTLNVAQDGITSMFDKNGKEMDFRQIGEDEIRYWLHDGLVTQE